MIKRLLYLKNAFASLAVLLVLLVSSNGFGQTVWTYDFGTVAKTHTSNSAVTNFFSGTVPNPPTGSGTYRVRVGSGSGSVSLVNPGTTLGTGAELQITAPTNNSTNKFSVYGWDTPSTSAYLKCKIRTEATNTGSFWIMIGANTGIYSDNNNTTFTNAVSQLFFSYNSSGVLTVQRRDGNAYNATAISSITEATNHSLEFYVNNSSSSTTYTKNSTTYTLNSQSWDLWVDGTKISATNGWAKGAGSSSISANTNIGAFGFFAETSSSNNAKLYIDDIEYSNGLPTAPAGPEINIQGNGVTIADGDTTPSLTDHTDFGSTAVTGGTVVRTFTIENTGTADLNISSITSSNNTEFEIGNISLPTTVGTVSPVTFTVTFDPSTIGDRNSTITIANNDDDEASYVFIVQGTGVNSNTSDIIADTGFAYTSNINYVSFQSATIPTQNDGLGAFRFIIRDGGGIADADALGTELTAITFNVTNIANIRTARLYDGTTLINSTPTINTGLNTITFAGLSGANVTAADNNTKVLTLYVSFLTSVTDNQQLTYTIASTTTNSAGSSFATTNAGGASSITSGDINRIEVTATQLAFQQQPTNTGINAVMTPAVSVSANDINGNRDTDFVGAVEIESYGTLSGTSTTATNAVNGLAVFNNLIHTAIGTGLLLEATHNNGWNVESDEFDITEITYSIEDYRTISGGTWSTQTNGTATWEKWNGVGWVNSSRPTQNTNNVYIRHTITSNGSSTVAKIIVEGPNATEATPGGIYTITSGTTTINNHLLIEKDGIMNANNTISVSGIFEIKNDGEFNLNFVANNNSTLWNATEIFHPDSNFIIKEWSVNNSNSNYRTLVNGLKINTNTYDGYSAIFGNLIIDLSNSTQASGSFVILDGDISINLTHGDLHLLQPHPSNNINIKGTGALTTSGVGGNFIVDDAFNTSRKVLIATTGALDFTVKGNMQLDGATTNITSSTSSTNFNITIKGDLNINPSAVLDFVASSTSNPIINLNLEGNLNGTGSGLLRGQSNGNNFNFNFTGSYESSNPLTIQKIDIASTSTSENNRLNFNIKSGAYVQLVNRNFELGSGSKLIVEDGGTFDFGLNNSGTALNVMISGAQTGTTFDAKAGSILKITSPDGIASSGAFGNVQTATRTFGVANYHYVGTANQITGTGQPAIVGDLVSDNSNLVTLSNAVTVNGKLEVIKGILDLNSKVTQGSSSTVKIDDAATLRITGTATFPTGFTTHTIANNSIVDYAGTTQAIAALLSPGYGKLKVSGTGTKVLSGTTVEATNSLAITSSLLEISEGQTLRIENEITTVDTDATNGLFIKNGGSVIQTTEVNNQTSNANVGKVRMERITKPMYRLDYTYWSAPVSGNTLVALSPNSPANKFFHWNPDAVSPAPNWVVITGGTAQMLPGKGYIIRAPTVGNGTDASNPASYVAFNGYFNGKPNNGTVTTPVSGPEKWNLIGNPYPSAIDAEKFLDDNAILDGTLYFWTHNTPLTGASGYGYSSEDYAAWNGTGSLATVEALSDTDPADNKPKGFIAAGQSFFVKGLNDGNAVFTNSMRENANNMQFFRSSNTEKHRVWLNLKGAEKGFSQTLVGYISNATNGQDQRYDGASFGGNAVTFYSVMENKNWSIQGRALPFTTADEVPLGYKTTLTGTLIINIDDRDGQLTTQNIYLKDNLLNVVHNLTDSAYTFTSTPGTYNDRFVLRYLPGEDLDNPTFEDQMNGLTIRKNNADIYINSSFENIDAVLIYDTTGRLLFEKEKCNTTSFKASNLTQSEQMLIVKVRLNNGGVLTKKVW